MDPILILIPAAGSSQRMRGADKLMETIAGEPLLERSVRIACATAENVAVTVPKDNPARAGLLVNSSATVLKVDASEGMAASLRAGARRALAFQYGGLLVHLADMPDIETADLVALIAAFRTDPDSIWRACSADGQPGNPVLLPRRCFEAVAALTGDSGARAMLSAENVRFHLMPDGRALADLDTPEDWAAWRKKSPKNAK